MTDPSLKHSHRDPNAAAIPAARPSCAPGRASAVQRKYGGLAASGREPIDFHAAHARGEAHHAAEAARPASPDPFDLGYAPVAGSQAVQRQASADPIVDSIDAPAADSIQEDRATIDTAEGSLTARQLAKAQRRNRHWAGRLGFSAGDFGSSAPVASAAFAEQVAGLQAAQGLVADGIAGPKTHQAVGASGGNQLEDGVLGPADELEDGVLGPADELEAGLLGGGGDQLEDGLLGMDDPLFTGAPANAAGGGETLESGLIDEAVQAKDMASVEDTDAVHSAAAHGLQGGAQELPFRAQIEASTGQDLSAVQAHIGGPATEASAAMGAQAYATGNHVVFAQQPDLHTAAHEAAHVVQQRAGVQLLGGVGQAGDPYERQADQVADAVVRGESAAATSVPASNGKVDGAIQRKDAGELRDQPIMWMEQKLQTLRSFDLIREAISTQVDDWRTYALIDGPAPPDWKTQLLGVASMVIGGLLGFVAARMVAGLGGSGVGAQIATTLIKTGESQIRAEVAGQIAAVADLPGHERKAALVAFSIAQRDALKAAVMGAAGHFTKSAQLGPEPAFSRAEMARLQRANLNTLGTLQPRIERDLTVGWMNLLVGSGGMRGANLGEDGDQVGDLDNTGALVLELVSDNGLPTISRARADGLSPAVQAMLAGKPLRYWLGGADGKFEHGVDLVMLTKHNSYVLPDHIYEAVAGHGGYGSEPELRQQITRRKDTVVGHFLNGGAPRRDANDLQVAHFGLGRSRDGAWSWVSDYGGWISSDEGTGWKAGRILIRELFGGREGLLNFLLDDPIPRIG